MDALKEFSIPFVGLSVGKHEFNFEITDKFFEHFEYSLIKQGRITAFVELDKKERMLHFDINFKGNVKTTCDRCTEEFELPVSGREQLFVKFGEEFIEESDEVVIIPESEYKFDIAPYIYEYIHLALPARILHPDDENGNSACNPEMLKRIKNLIHTESADPRWETLRKLKTDN